jgi:hypothetical protein
MRAADASRAPLPDEPDARARGSPQIAPCANPFASAPPLIPKGRTPAAGGGPAPPVRSKVCSARGARCPASRRIARRTLSATSPPLTSPTRERGSSPPHNSSPEPTPAIRRVTSRHEFRSDKTPPDRGHPDVHHGGSVLAHLGCLLLPPSDPRSPPPHRMARMVHGAFPNFVGLALLRLGLVGNTNDRLARALLLASAASLGAAALLYWVLHIPI